MSGMTETETLKTLTPMTTIMGLVGLVTVILGAMVLPMK
jgi:GntP family gluconate:H+ symporter